LRVLVVNDPPLATAINRLRGEWTEREGGTFAAESKPWVDVAAADNIDTDVIVFPMRYLGEMADRLRPIRESVSGSRLHDIEDLLPLVRQKLGVYGGRSLAFPIGVQVPLVGYYDEWLQPGSAPPPASWQEHHALVSRVGEAPPVWPARDAIDNWPAIMLLARAAAYACHPRQESPLFDPVSMAPRIAGPPFVRALDEWLNETRSSISASADNTPKGILHWAELPGTEQVFNQSTGEWEPVPNISRRVPFLAGGTLIAVTGTSRNAASAFELAAWLSSSEIVSKIVPAGTVLLPCRRSNLPLADRWIADSTDRGGRAKVAHVVEAALTSDDCLMVPRIPGVDKYLAELANAVEIALRGELSPASALEQGTSRWNDITDGLGRDSQRRAYLNHLGQAAP
jgi:hypothetical protein